VTALPGAPTAATDVPRDTGGAVFAQRVFGASRKIYLAAATANTDTRRHEELTTRTATLVAEIGDLSRHWTVVAVVARRRSTPVVRPRSC
jgi:hypothetical protein